MPKGVYARTHSNTKGKHWKLSQEICNKLSKLRKGKHTGAKSALYGRAQTKEHRQHNAQAHIGMRNSGMFGKHHSEQTKRLISESSAKSLQNGRWLGKSAFYREDLKRYFKSNLEANYARFLNHMNIKWQYEPKRFKLSNGRHYVPDFYLLELDMWIELKGFMRFDAKEKIEFFQKEYPDLKFKVIMQNSIEWKYIVDEYSLEISNWEPM